MTRPRTVVNVSTRARRTAILHECAREHVHNLVAIVMIYISPAIAPIPLDQNGPLAGLWILEEGLPSGARPKLKPLYRT
jgi:hypothetical protein